MSGDLSNEWFVRTRGKVLGPFAFRQLEILRNQGRLAKFDEISHGDRRSWALASTNIELFPVVSDPEPELEDRATDTPYSIEPLPTTDSTIWHYMGLLGSSAPIPLTELIHLANTGVVQPETLVWTAAMSDWVPAKTVPALGLSRSPVPAGNVVTDSPSATANNQATSGGSGFSIAGFILGLLGLFCSLLTFVVPTVSYSAKRNSELIGMIFVGMMVTWAVFSLLAVTFGTIGMIKASRDEKRRGMGLGIAALILGMLGLAGLAVLVFIAALGVIAIRS